MQDSESFKTAFAHVLESNPDIRKAFELLVLAEAYEIMRKADDAHRCREESRKLVAAAQANITHDVHKGSVEA